MLPFRSMEHYMDEDNPVDSTHNKILFSLDNFLVRWESLFSSSFVMAGVIKCLGQIYSKSSM